MIATHQWSATTDNGDGTYGVNFEVTFTNAGATAIDDLTVELIDTGVAPVLPGENVLTVGSLTPGETINASWRITTYAPMAAAMAVRPLFIHGEGIDEDGIPVGIGILSRGRPAARSAAAVAEGRAMTAREASAQ